MIIDILASLTGGFLASFVYHIWKDRKLPYVYKHKDGVSIFKSSQKLNMGEDWELQ